MPKPHISIELHQNKSKEGQRNRNYDYELGEFFRSLQDLLALSLDANLSFDSAEFLSRRLDGFERTFSVLSSRVRVSHPSEK